MGIGGINNSVSNITPITRIRCMIFILNASRAFDVMETKIIRDVTEM